jgi:hypothetical protein
MLPGQQPVHPGAPPSVKGSGGDADADDPAVRIDDKDEPARW